MERALFSSDNCYNTPNFRAVGHLCKTNVPTRTAMRGFGAPQSILITENIINDVATFLGIRPDKVLTSGIARGGLWGSNPLH